MHKSIYRNDATETYLLLLRPIATTFCNSYNKFSGFFFLPVLPHSEPKHVDHSFHLHLFPLIVLKNQNIHIAHPHYPLHQAHQTLHIPASDEYIPTVAFPTALIIKQIPFSICIYQFIYRNSFQNCSYTDNLHCFPKAKS